MVSCRQPLSYLKESDEIEIQLKDIAILSYLVDKDYTYPGDIVIFVDYVNNIEWAKIDIYKDILNITFAIQHYDHYEEIAAKGYKFFWSYPITSYWELNRIVKTGVSQVVLGAPLYFALPKVRKLIGEDIEIRLYANICYDGYIPCDDGVTGTYIRPEDVETYEAYIQHICFITDGLQKERTLVKIYKEHYWPGNLNLLLTNLGYDIDNRAFSSIFAERRTHCGHICQEGRCSFCHTHFDLITAIDRNQDWLREQLS